jgi:hypothetical protein
VRAQRAAFEMGGTTEFILAELENG